MIVINQNLIKQIISNNTVKEVHLDDYSLKVLEIDDERIWYPCYKGHFEVIDTAVAPTCTTTGLTEGSHCSACNEVFVAQEVIPALGHIEGELITVKEPTLTETGLMQRECTVCHEVTYYEIIDKLGPVVYELSNDETYYIARAYSTDIEGEIKIGAYYRGLPVTHIKQDAFKDCLNITKVVIPYSVTTIGHSAFRGCSSITSVDIGNNVTSIGGSAFRNCSSLTSITIPDSVTSIGWDAFSECERLTSVVIGDGVTSIGINAFAYCYDLTNVVMGDSVTSIGSYAFYKCYKLTSIAITDSVTYIGSSAFKDCDNLDSVYITDIAKWCNIEFDGNLSNPLNQIGELYVNGELVTELVIPDDVTKINNYAFGYCSSITSVVIPDSVTSIGDYAFLSCNLNDVCFGENSQLTSIGKQAFLYCMFTGITIPSSVTHIGAKAFGRLFSSSFEVTLLNNTACWELSNPDDESAEHINVNNYTATQLGKMFVGNKHEYEWNAREHAYGEWSVTKEPTCSSPGTKHRECSRCGYPQTLDIPATGVHDYKLSVTLPTCTKMGYTTYMCTHCSHSYVDMDSYVEAKGHSPSDWIIDIEPTLVAEGSKHKECNHCGEILETAPIPKLEALTYTLLSDGTYEVSLTKDIVSPNVIDIPSIYKGIPVTKIAEGGFKDNIYIHEVILPEGIVHIGARAFFNCSMLGYDLVIPSTVELIESDAFGQCDSIRTITFTSGSANTYIENGAFSDCHGLQELNISSSVTHIEDGAFERCYGIESISVEEGNQKYHSQDNCLIETTTNTVILGCKNSIIPESATTINSGSFYLYAHQSPIKIPLSVITVNSLAFSECEDAVVYVEAISKPNRWADDWNDGSVTVVWGYVEDTNTYLVTESGEFLTDEQGNLLIL